MPRGASPKREREYEELKDKFHKSRRYGKRADQVAARIVNKQRAQYGETKAEKQEDRQGKSPDRNLPLDNYRHLTIENSNPSSSPSPGPTSTRSRATKKATNIAKVRWTPSNPNWTASKPAAPLIPTLTRTSIPQLNQEARHGRPRRRNRPRNRRLPLPELRRRRARHQGPQDPTLPEWP